MKIIFLIVIIVILLILIATIILLHHNKNKGTIDPMLIQLKNDLIEIDPRVHHIEFYSNSESFTEDKYRIHICLYDENKQYYPYNTLIEVAIHELAHSLCSVHDPKHETSEYLNLYQDLINRAVVLSLYDPEQPPENYQHCMQKK